VNAAFARIAACEPDDLVGRSMHAASDVFAQSVSQTA
jgi:hypothetical protein